MCDLSLCVGGYLCDMSLYVGGYLCDGSLCVRGGVCDVSLCVRWSVRETNETFLVSLKFYPPLCFGSFVSAGSSAPFGSSGLFLGCCVQLGGSEVEEMDAQPMCCGLNLLSATVVERGG